jgi:hypothetical protein
MGRRIGRTIERLTDPEAQFIDGLVDQLKVVVPEIGEEHQIANAALPALSRPVPGDFDVMNVQSRPRAFIDFIRQVHQDATEYYNPPGDILSGSGNDPCP